MIVTFYKPSEHLADATGAFYTTISPEADATGAIRVYGITDLYVSGNVIVLKDDDKNQAVIDHKSYVYFDCV